MCEISFSGKTSILSPGMKEITNNCPVPGWKRIICQRKTGRTAGKFDVYFLNPDGKRLRSRREISRYLKESALDISLDMFCFRAAGNVDERALTKVKERRKEKRSCQSLTQSCYFNEGKAESEDWDVSMVIGSSIGVKEKNSSMKQESKVDEQETQQQSVSQVHDSIVQQAKIQTSPYFERNCLSPKAKPVRMDASREEKISLEPSENSIVRLPPKEQISKDFESVPPGLPSSLSPKPLRMNIYGKETMSLQPSNSTLSLVCLPNQGLSKAFESESSRFPNRCLSPKPLRMNIYGKETMSTQPPVSTLVHLPNQGLSKDFESESSGLTNCLYPKPLRMNIYDKEAMSLQPSNSTLGLVCLPTQGLSKDFESQSSGLTNCLSPKPLGLSNLNEERTPLQASDTTIMTLPNQREIPQNFESLPPGLQKFYTLQYTPPKSPFNLIQEELYKDPWKLLVATIFLNKTGGRNAIPVLWKFFEQFPDADATSKADSTQLEDIIQPLGLFRKRAQILIRFSTEYLGKAWHYPSELYGIGKYGNDSFRIFCLGEYQDVLPDDHKLNLYHGWLCERDREGMAASIL